DDPRDDARAVRSHRDAADVRLVDRAAMAALVLPARPHARRPDRRARSRVQAEVRCAGAEPATGAAGASRPGTGCAGRRVSRPRVFVARTLPGDAVERLREQAEVDQWTAELPPPHETLLARLRDADGAITLLTDRIDAALLAACPRLRVVSNVAVGYDNIDVTACTTAGVLAT